MIHAVPFPFFAVLSACVCICIHLVVLGYRIQDLSYSLVNYSPLCSFILFRFVGVDVLPTSSTSNSFLSTSTSSAFVNFFSSIP